jgi:threonine dehydratase
LAAPTGAGANVTVEDVLAAREAIAGVARRTPVLPSATLTERTGASVVLKAESLQRTGSFKVRGAACKVRRLGPAAARGVVAASAGNHAQALAHAAQELGVPCEVFMPAEAPLTKVEGARALGARVELTGASLGDCMAAATERVRSSGMALVHPYDDPDVIAGQGTLGLELLEDVADLARVVVPVGGGGLAAGVAVAIKARRPAVEIVGVQVEGCTPLGPLVAGEVVPDGGPGLSIADGIAVKRPGDLPLALLRERLDDAVVVGEDETAAAMVMLLERARLVVEGAGAVGVAALLCGLVGPPASGGTTAVVLTGGNVDAGLLAEVARHRETQAGRRLVVLTRLTDRPGSLARLLTLVGGTGANLIEVSHVREGIDLHVRETAIQLVLETRGREHAERVLTAIGRGGYQARVLSG